MTLATKLDQTLRGKASEVLNVLGRRGVDMRRADAVTSFAFDPRPDTSFGNGGVAIETPGNNIRGLFLSERGLSIGRRVSAVVHGQSRPITHGIPGNPVLEILAIDRPNWRDPVNARPRRPIQVIPKRSCRRGPQSLEFL